MDFRCLYSQFTGNENYYIRLSISMDYQITQNHFDIKNLYFNVRTNTDSLIDSMVVRNTPRYLSCSNLNSRYIFDIV